MKNHSPTPWSALYQGQPDCAYSIHAALPNGGQSGRIATICPAGDVVTTDANRDTLLAAINSFDDLLAAFRCALADLEGFEQEAEWNANHPAILTIRELRNAIAKAEGGRRQP